MKYLRKEMRMFFRSIYLPIVFGLGTIYYYTIHIRSIIEAGKNLFAMNAYRYIGINQGGGLLLFALMLFIGYELSQKRKNQFSSELIDAYPGSRGKTTLAKAGVLGILSVFLFITLMMFNVYFIVKANNYYLPFLINVFLSTLLAYFLIPWMAGLLGMALGELAERYSGFVLMAALLFFMSPISTRLLSSFMGLGSGTSGPKRIFSFFTPNTGYFINLVYGIPIEAQRWLLVLFWVCAAGLILVYKAIKNKKIVSGISAILVVTMALSFYYGTVNFCPWVLWVICSTQP